MRSVSLLLVSHLAHKTRSLYLLISAFLPARLAGNNFNEGISLAQLESTKTRRRMNVNGIIFVVRKLCGIRAAKLKSAQNPIRQFGDFL